MPIVSAAVRVALLVRAYRAPTTRARSTAVVRLAAARRPDASVRGLDEAGMVTAETAVVLPVLVFVLAAALAAVSVVTAQLRCTDAAREGARAAARGESGAAVREISAASAPESSVVSVNQDEETVTVEVSAAVPLFPGLGPSITVSDTATAALEPGVEAAAAPFALRFGGARPGLEHLTGLRAGDPPAPP